MPTPRPSLRRAFTLIEIVVASVLSTVLLSALLSATASISRDRKHLAEISASPTPAETQAVVQLLRQDLINARSFICSTDGSRLTIVGHCGLTEGSYMPSGRLVEVNYRIQPAENGGARLCLVREQRLLDDPTGANPWAELVAVGVSRMDVTATSPETTTMPARVRLRMDFDRRFVEENLWLR